MADTDIADSNAAWRRGSPKDFIGDTVQRLKTEGPIVSSKASEDYPERKIWKSVSGNPGQSLQTTPEAGSIDDRVRQRRDNKVGLVSPPALKEAQLTQLDLETPGSFLSSNAKDEREWWGARKPGVAIDSAIRVDTSTAKMESEKISTISPLPPSEETSPEPMEAASNSLEDSENEMRAAEGKNEEVISADIPTPTTALAAESEVIIQSTSEISAERSQPEVQPVSETISMEFNDDISSISDEKSESPRGFDSRIRNELRRGSGSDVTVKAVTEPSSKSAWISLAILVMSALIGFWFLTSIGVWAGIKSNKNPGTIQIIVGMVCVITGCSLLYKSAITKIGSTKLSTAVGGALLVFGTVVLTAVILLSANPLHKIFFVFE